MRFHWYDQSVAQIADPEHDLAISETSVREILARYEATGDVATHQGQGADQSSRRLFTRVEDWKVLQLLIDTPRATRGLERPLSSPAQGSSCHFHARPMPMTASATPRLSVCRCVRLL